MLRSFEQFIFPLNFFFFVFQNDFDLISVTTRPHHTLIYPCKCHCEMPTILGIFHSIFKGGKDKVADNEP